ncbi:hypothetical protein D910_04675 [Dendroctonus ponderosae]|uniref:Reverse transcriptase domain-containing protein n=1 Tax=Dendroctonus ponderosae TaxID=77166 RepID=U4U081_DENPD|nr:hypothetical protein D910_04675 [Dendroctonus ponderosae]
MRNSHLIMKMLNASYVLCKKMQDQQTNYLQDPQTYTKRLPIDYSKTIKYLGITINPRLNFNAHIATALKKAHRTTACLYPLLSQKSTLSLKNKILIYKQVITSQICYTAPILSQTSKSAITKLQRFQNKIFRRMTRPPWYVRNSQIHANLEMETIEDFISRLYDKFKARVLSHPNPLIKSTFAQKIPKHNYRTPTSLMANPPWYHPP